MKSILEYCNLTSNINEDLNKRKYLADIISTASDKVIDMLYQTAKTEAIFDPLHEYLRTHMNVPESQVKSVSFQIMSSFTANNDVDSLVNLLNPNNQMRVDVNKVVSGSNIYQVLKPSGVSINTMKDLMTVCPNINNTMTGRYEILCMLLIDDIHQQKGAADVQAADKNMEFKTKLARPMGQKFQVSSSVFYYSLSQIFKKHHIEMTETPFSGPTNAKEFLTYCYQKFDTKSIPVIFNAIGDSLDKMYSTKESIKFFKSLISHATGDPTKDNHILMRGIGSYMLYQYCIREEFTHIVIFEESDNGDYKCVKRTDIKSPMDIYNWDWLKFSGGPYNPAKSPRDNYIQFSYTKKKHKLF